MSDKLKAQSPKPNAEDVAIKVDGVSKTFKLPHEKQTSLKGLFLSSFKKKSFEKQEALKDVSFEIKKGEFFGIVGRNGSGKSTLLKIMAGIYQPSKGNIKVNGKLVPFIELGVGFNPELTGRENVFLNGALLGFTRKQMSGMYEEIVEFAELERFMDQKLKNYSSGMQVRLAFAIAIRARGDILLLDEVLAVGDTAFQKKCNDYFYKLKEQGQTVILVTHSMGAVEEYCDRAMLINNGKMVSISNPTKVADLYNELNLRSSITPLEKHNRQVSTTKNSADEFRHGRLVNVATYNPATGKKQDTFSYKEKIGVRYLIEAFSRLEAPTAGLVFRDKKGNQVFATNTPSMGVKLEDLKPGQKVEIEFEIDNVFANGDYLISGGLASKDRAEVYHKVNDIHVFEVGGWKFPDSIIHPRHEIHIGYK